MVVKVGMLTVTVQRVGRAEARLTGRPGLVIGPQACGRTAASGRPGDCEKPASE